MVYHGDQLLTRWITRCELPVVSFHLALLVVIKRGEGPSPFLYN